MTLPKEQRTEIRFNDGNDESEYDEATANMLVVSNGEYLKDGGVQKRAGFTALSSAGGVAAEAHPLSLLGTRGGYALMRKRDAILGYGNQVVSTSSTSTMRRSNWHSNVSARGSLHATKENTFPGFSEVDGAVLTASNGRTYTLLVGSANAIYARYVAVDAETGMAVHAGELEADAKIPRATAHGGYFYIYYIHGSNGDIKRVRFDPSVAGAGPVSTVATVAAATATASAGEFDAFAGNGKVVLAYAEGGNLYVKAITPGTDTVTFTSAGAILGAGTHRLGVCCDAAGITHVINGRDTTTYIIRRYDATLTLTDTTTPSGQSNLTHTRVGIAIATNTSVASAPVLACAWNGTTTSTTADTFSYSILRNDHTVVGAAVELPRLTMLSKPFIEYGLGDASQQSDVEPVYACTFGRYDDNAVGHVFVGRLDPTLDLPSGVTGVYNSNYVEPMASLYATGGSGSLLRPTVASQRAVSVPNVTPVIGMSSWGESTFDWYIPQLKFVEALSAPAEGHLLGSPDPFIFGCSMLRLEHAVCDPLPRARVGGFGWTGGGLARVHDGQELGEVTPLFPAPKPTLSNHGSGTLDAGTYVYCHVLSYEDSVGRLYRSAPSAEVSITVTANHDVDVTAVASMPTMRNPDGLGSDVPLGHWRSEIYRTFASGAGNFQLVASRPVVIGTSYTIQDALEDADLDANKFLYTTGGVLANEAPPPASALVAHGDRVFAVDAADRRSLVFSKPFEEGIAPEFNNELRLRFDSLDSDMVSLASMDDKLLLFTSGNVYTMTGDGPNALGVGSFNPPELVAQGVGLLAPYALAVLPAGVLFYSTSGFKLLDRGLGITDLSGAAFNRANNPTLASDAPLRMEHIPALQQVWMCGGGTERTQANTGRNMQVFDYARAHPRWLSHDLASAANGGILDIVDVGGQPHFLLQQSTTAFVYRRSISQYADGAIGTLQHYSLSVLVQRWRGGYRTPDGRFSEVGLLDELRVRRVHVVASGDGYTSRLQLVASDARQPRSFDTTHTETYVWAPGDLQDGTYGHVETRLRYQRVTSVDLEVSTLKQVASGGEDDAGPVLHALIVDWAPTGRTARRGAAFDPV